MRLLALIACLLGSAGCYYAIDSQSEGGVCADDPMQRFATDPATGTCYEFASSCDVPKEWPPCPGSMNGCGADAECPPGLGCVNGACEARGAGCMADDQCALTQHCDPSTAACGDNDACAMDSECPMGQFCDMIAVGDCDPNVPGCEMPMFVGLCSREAPGLNESGCTTNADCTIEQICPAQYGGCSFDEMPPADGNLCPSNCETACYDDLGCAMGTRCNANDVCGQPNPGNGGGGMVPLPCAGWCVSIMP